MQNIYKPLQTKNFIDWGAILHYQKVHFKGADISEKYDQPWDIWDLKFIILYNKLVGWPYLDVSLRFRVQGGGRLVEYHYSRVLRYNN